MHHLKAFRKYLVLQNNTITPKGTKMIIIYLTTHSIHFYFGHMFNDLSDDEIENPLQSFHQLLFQINNIASVICTIPYHDHELGQWVRQVGSIRPPTAQ